MVLFGQPLWKFSLLALIGIAVTTCGIGFFGYGLMPLEIFEALGMIALFGFVIGGMISFKILVNFWWLIIIAPIVFWLYCQWWHRL